MVLRFALDISALLLAGKYYETSFIYSNRLLNTFYIELQISVYPSKAFNVNHAAHQHHCHPPENQGLRPDALAVHVRHRVSDSPE